MAILGLSPINYMLRYMAGKQTDWAWSQRRDFYSLAEAYYGNSAYESLADGGFRDYLLEEYGGDVASKITGIYNPVKRAVDIYKYTLAGKFGRDVKIEGSPKIVKAIEQIYKWTNWDIEKRALTIQAASLGTVGIRISARNNPSPRVYLKFEHPKRIKDIQMDDRGNVEKVLLEYPRLEGRLGEQREEHTIEELLTPEYFETYRDGERWDMVNNTKNGPLWKYPNLLGVTPYVLLRHSYNGDDWGLPAWHGQAGPVDAVNILASHIDEQIRRHIKVKWMMVASGKPPQIIDMGDSTVAYVQVDPTSSAPPPSLDPLVAPLNLADAIAALDQKIEALRANMPELAATDTKFLSGQSGETIAQLRLPAEELIYDARANYEDALVRANKIALSWGIYYGIWDLGTGSGKQAAQDAFEQGLEDHEFGERAGLPDTPYDKLDLKTRLYSGIEILDRIGAISLEEKVRQANPDKDEAWIKKELGRIEEASTVTPPDTGSEGAGVDPLASFMGTAMQAAPAPAQADGQGANGAAAPGQP